MDVHKYRPISGFCDLLSYRKQKRRLFERANAPRGSWVCFHEKWSGYRTIFLAQAVDRRDIACNFVKLCLRTTETKPARNLLILRTHTRSLVINESNFSNSGVRFIGPLDGGDAGARIQLARPAIVAALVEPAQLAFHADPDSGNHD